MIKASAGGGGKGMRVVRGDEDLEALFAWLKMKRAPLSVMIVFLLKNMSILQGTLNFRFL